MVVCAFHPNNKKVGGGEEVGHYISYFYTCATKYQKGNVKVCFGRVSALAHPGREGMVEEVAGALQLFGPENRELVPEVGLGYI